MDIRWTFHFGEECLLARPATRLTGVSPSGRRDQLRDRRSITVTPLPAWLERYGKGKDADPPRTLAWGGRCVLQALSFLHSTKRCHGSLTPDAIFVTAAGDWKLWGFELATSLDPLAPNNGGLGFFRAHGSLVDDAYRAPERKRNDWEGMANNRVGASDVWALSALLERAYAGRGGAPRELWGLAQARVKSRTREAAVLRPDLAGVSLIPDSGARRSRNFPACRTFPPRRAKTRTRSSATWNKQQSAPRQTASRAAARWTRPCFGARASTSYYPSCWRRWTSPSRTRARAPLTRSGPACSTPCRC